MNKLLGGTFLISGTAVGGGVVLLPAIIGVYGYLSAMILLTLIWLMNVIIAFIFLEANFYLPNGSSMISMTQVFFGKNMRWLTWTLSVIFLYTLLSAYISGMSEILNSLFHIPNNYTALLAILFVSIPIFLGFKYISTFNDFIVIGMFILLFIIFICLGKQINAPLIFETQSRFPLIALPIVFTAFGFTVIVPSLRIYFDNNLKLIKKSFLIGTTIPFIIYIIWITIIMGMIPALGEQSLNSILADNQPVNTFKSILIFKSHYPNLSWIIEAFILTAFASSFIGIALATYHFLADGLKITRNAFGKFKLLVLIFLPPFLITAFENKILIKALGIAGLLSTIVFGIFPLLFVWLARYKYKLKSEYTTPFSKSIFVLLFGGCLLVIGVELLTLMKL